MIWSTLDAVYVYLVPWSELTIVPSYPHYPQKERGHLENAAGTTTSERTGNNLKGVQDFYLKVKPRVWPDCLICARFARQLNVNPTLPYKYVLEVFPR